MAVDPEEIPQDYWESHVETHPSTAALAAAGAPMRLPTHRALKADGREDLRRVSAHAVSLRARWLRYHGSGQVGTPEVWIDKDVAHAGAQAAQAGQTAEQEKPAFG